MCKNGTKSTRLLSIIDEHMRPFSMCWGVSERASELMSAWDLASKAVSGDQANACVNFSGAAIACVFGHANVPVPDESISYNFLDLVFKG